MRSVSVSENFSIEHNCQWTIRKKTHKFICNLFYSGHFNGLFRKFPNCLGNQITYFRVFIDGIFFKYSSFPGSSCPMRHIVFFINIAVLSQTEKKLHIAEGFIYSLNFFKNIFTDLLSLVWFHWIWFISNSQETLGLPNSAWILDYKLNNVKS